MPRWFCTRNSISFNDGINSSHHLSYNIPYLIIFQAIGRVIRHKKDWGAIFLLDDRFHYDKQVSQLSSWVRPRLKKYSQCTPALTDFRKFLSSAMIDPDLRVRALLLFADRLLFVSLFLYVLVCLPVINWWTRKDALMMFTLFRIQ